MKVFSMVFLVSILSLFLFGGAISMYQNDVPDVSKQIIYNVDFLRGLEGLL